MENKIDEATKVAVELSEHLDAKEQAMFIAGFQECIKWKSEQSEWILCDDDMPEENETVWITNGRGWTDLGCLVECEGGYCWAVTNGIIYEENGKIVSECELDDDYDVVFWHRLPMSTKYPQK